MLTGEVLTAARTITLLKVKDVSVGKHALGGQTRFDSSLLFVGRQLSGASLPWAALLPEHWCLTVKRPWLTPRSGLRDCFSKEDMSNAIFAVN